MFLNNIFIAALDFVSYIIYWPPLFQDKGFFVFVFFLLLPNPSFLFNILFLYLFYSIVIFKFRLAQCYIIMTDQCYSF